jgi:uracil-DNA glycosylase
MFNDYNTPDKDKDGCYFIDRSGKYFDHILEFLRDDDYLPPVDIMNAVIRDAIYFHLREYAERLENYIL